jgi:hypothetical protein
MWCRNCCSSEFSKAIEKAANRVVSETYQFVKPAGYVQPAGKKQKRPPQEAMSGLEPEPQLTFSLAYMADLEPEPQLHLPLCTTLPSKSSFCAPSA